MREPVAGPDTRRTPTPVESTSWQASVCTGSPAALSPRRYRRRLREPPEKSASSRPDGGAVRTPQGCRSVAPDASTAPRPSPRNAGPTVTWGRSRSSSRGPTPRTARRSSTARNGPNRRRCSRIRPASTGPTPGSASSSGPVARLRSTATRVALDAGGMGAGANSVVVRAALAPRSAGARGGRRAWPRPPIQSEAAPRASNNTRSVTARRSAGVRTTSRGIPRGRVARLRSRRRRAPRRRAADRRTEPSCAS